MKEISLTQGKVTLVDDEDFENLSKYKWHAHHGRFTFYAARLSRPSNKTIMMHRAIMCPMEGQAIDHINDDGLDNRRSNLRIATYSQNAQNQRKRVNNTSGYIGVSWDKAQRKWRSQIKINQKQKKLGRFDNIHEAYEAYRQAAKEHFGEFARL
jgi:hypothetical protein